MVDPVEPIFAAPELAIVRNAAGEFVTRPWTIVDVLNARKANAVFAFGKHRFADAVAQALAIGA